MEKSDFEKNKIEIYKILKEKININEVEKTIN